jgi:hypothetical protein
MEIPYKIMMSNTTASQCPEIRSILEHSLFQIPSLSLAIHLLYEKHKVNSFWKAYIKTLPEILGVPLFWSLEELLFLEGSVTLEETLKLIILSVKQYIIIFHLLKQAKNNILDPFRTVTYSEFIWSLAIVMSRQNKIPTTEETFELALIPVWDLCNHKIGTISTFFDFQNKNLQCFSIQKFSKGDQIFIHYGDRPNSQLLLYSGFLIKNNPNDILKIKIEIDKEDALYQNKVQTLQKITKNNFSNLNFHLTKDGNTSLHLKLICNIISINNEEDLIKFQTNLNNDKDQLEINPKSIVTQKLTQLFSQYETIQRSNAKIDVKNLSSNMENAILLLNLEKEIIQKGLNLLQPKKKNKKKKKKNVEGIENIDVIN